MRVKCIYSTLTCSFSRLFASLTNTDRHWSYSYTFLILKNIYTYIYTHGGQLTLRCNSAFTTLSKLQYFPPFPVPRHQITWIRWKFYISVCFVSLGSLDIMKNQRERWKQTKQFSFELVYFTWKQRFMRWLTGSSSFIQRFWRTPRHQRRTDDRDLFVSSEQVKAIVASQSEVWFVLGQNEYHPHPHVTTAAPHEDVWRNTHIRYTPTHKHTDKCKHAWSNSARS